MAEDEAVKSEDVRISDLDRPVVSEPESDSEVEELVEELPVSPSPEGSGDDLEARNARKPSSDNVLRAGAEPDNALRRL